jgi:hypothetical protein
MKMQENGKEPTDNRTMIERVAEAIWTANRPPFAPDFKELDVREQDIVEIIAIECIRAMREPTLNMLNMVEDSQAIHPGSIWKTMIDGALEEE